MSPFSSTTCHRVTRMLSTLVVLFAAAAPASATAIYDASGFAALTIQTLPSGVLADGDAFIFDHGAFTFGPSAHASDTPSASIIGANPMGVGDGIALSGDVMGDAGPEEAFSFVEGDGFILFENTSANDVVVQLLLDYSLSAHAAIDFLDEDAAAGASVTLFSDNLAIDFFDLALADAFFGPPGHSLSGLETFDLVLAPGQIEGVTMLVDTSGFAVSFREAPEPSTLLLLSVGLLAAVRARRRDE